MDQFLFLLILVSVSAFAKGENHTIEHKGDDGNINDDSDNDGSFPHAALSSSVGSFLLIILIGWLIYYFCKRNQTPEGFTQFNNDNEGNPPNRGRFRWRNRRFFRRNRRPNHYQNNAEARNATHVTIQPVLAIGIPSGDQNFVASAGEGRSVPMAPPAYDDSMNNQAIPSQFMNPPMPNQFVNPPIPNQYMNPTVPSQFMNLMPNNFNNRANGGKF